MEYSFKLPPDWVVSDSESEDGYYFWNKTKPELSFTLTKTALAIYGDDPRHLATIISMQIRDTQS